MNLSRRYCVLFPQRIKSIALFGSRATGKAKKDSDYDVFIMVDKSDRNLIDTILDMPMTYTSRVI